MRRRLLQLATALSLLLCVTTVSLWVRSYWIWDRLDLVSKVNESTDGIAYGLYGLNSRYGSLSIWLIPYLETQPRVSAQWGKWLYTRERTWQLPHVMAAQRVSLLWRFRLFLEGNGFHIAFPDWAIVLLTGLLPMIELRRWRRRRHWRRENRCASCGYDLRASPEICPECGAGCAH